MNDLKNRSVKIYEDKVEKYFDSKDWYTAEKDSYLNLEKFNNLPVLQDWNIVTPKVLKIDDDNKSILMTLLPGFNINEILRSKRKVDWFVIGASVASFHTKIFDLYNRDLAYGDMGFGNILLCEDHNTVGFIDPGVDFLEEAPCLQDLIILLWVISTSRFKYLRMFFGAEKKLIDGYFLFKSSFIKDYDVEKSLNRSLKSVECKLKPRMKKKGKIKYFLFVLFFFLFKLMCSRRLLK